MNNPKLLKKYMRKENPQFKNGLKTKSAKYHQSRKIYGEVIMKQREY